VGALVGAGIFVTIMLMLVVAYLVVHRRETVIPARRREVKQLKADVAVAASTIRDVADVLDRYASLLTPDDVVGSALRQEVRDLVTHYDRQMLKKDR
jgi:hypothetical protein